MLAIKVLAGRDYTYAIQMGSSAMQRPAVTGRGRDFSSILRAPGTMGLASEWFNLSATSLPESVINYTKC